MKILTIIILLLTLNWTQAQSGPTIAALEPSNESVFIPL